MKKWMVVLIIFLLTVPLVMADLPKDEKEETTYKVVYDGARPIDDILKVKASEKSKSELDPYEKSIVLKEETDKVMKKEKYPLSISKDIQTDIKILAYTCDGKKYGLDTDGICGYWISATRDGKEVSTNSPIWISPPPYEAFISESYDEKKNEITVVIKEDSKLAVEQVLQQYVDNQPLGKSIVGTKE
jgi:hypothetical protein